MSWMASMSRSGDVEPHLAEQHADVSAGQRGLGADGDGLAAGEGGAGDLVVGEDEGDPGASVGDQAIERGSAGAERGLAGQDLFLEGLLVVVEQRLEDPGAGAEAAEDRALAEPGALGQRVHGSGPSAPHSSASIPRAVASSSLRLRAASARSGRGAANGSTGLSTGPA